MKVLNLQCAGMHTFEGWFGSEEDYQLQRERGLVACPLCANTEVRKLPSAPRLNLGAVEPRSSKPATQEEPAAASSSGLVPVHLQQPPMSLPHPQPKLSLQAWPKFTQKLQKWCRKLG